jgi:glucokinase
MGAILLADIGGTHSRFALAGATGRPERVVVIANDTVADLETGVAHYLAQSGASPRAAVLAVAGPIEGEDVTLTNRTWRFRRDEFAKRFALSKLRVVNDFEAIAWTLPSLGSADTRPLGTGATPRDATKVVLGPGTGLGVAALLRVDGRWQVVASEGGHVSFGPQAEDETEVFARVRREYGGMVSAEAVLSGPGLLRLARALDPQTRYRDPEAIVVGALAREPSALAVARLFVTLLGRFAGGLALTFKAFGGVYVTGGVGRGLGALLDEPQFRAAFEMHPPYEKLLKAIPTLLVTYEEPGLLGCATLAKEFAMTA